MYEYACELIRVVDGRSVELDIDLGLHVHVRIVAELFGVNVDRLMSNPLLAAKAQDHLNAVLSHEPLKCRTHAAQGGLHREWKVVIENCYGQTANHVLISNGYADRSTPDVLR